MLDTIQTIDLACVHGGQGLDPSVAKIEQDRRAFNKSVGTRNLADLGLTPAKVAAMSPKHQLNVCSGYFLGSREDDGLTSAPTERNDMIRRCKGLGFGF